MCQRHVLKSTHARVGHRKFDHLVTFDFLVLASGLNGVASLSSDFYTRQTWLTTCMLIGIVCWHSLELIYSHFEMRQSNQNNSELVCFFIGNIIMDSN